MTPLLKRGGVPIKRAGKRLRRAVAAPISLTITTTSLGHLEEGVAIASPGLPIVSVNGGFQVHTWEKISGPSWLSINGTGSTGRVLGTPPVGSNGDFTVVAKVTTTDGQTDTKTITGTVDVATPDLAISTTTLGAMTDGVAITSPGFLIQAVNGVGPFQWAKVSGPAWMNINTSSTTRQTRVTGTPSGAGSVTLRVRITDSLGESVEKDITGTVSPASSALDISTTTLGDMTENTVIPSPGFAVVAVNGSGTHTWSKLSGPSWLSISGTGATARINGTPPEGSAGNVSINVQVVSNGQTATQLLTGVVVDDAVDLFDGYYDRRIGFTKNQASAQQVEDAIVLMISGLGGDRIVGGLVRWDMGGTVSGGTDATDETILNKIKNKGVWAAPILGYTAKEHQRQIRFDGIIDAAKLLKWKDGMGGFKVGTGIREQMGDPGRTINGNSHPARIPSTANDYYGGPAGLGWFGPALGNPLSVHGPGIPVLYGYPCTITSGSNILNITMPTGDSKGANCPNSAWIGQQIQCPNVPAGATITQVIDATHLRMSANASASGARQCIIGFPGGDIPKAIGIDTQSGTIGFTLTNPAKATAGAQGTYYVGGTNGPTDQKMWYDDPTDYQLVCYNTIRDCNVPTKRAKRAELWNEMNWGMGSRPMTSIPRAARLLWHGYVGCKLADPSIIVCLPGTGHTGDPPPQWLSAPQWYEALLNFWYNVDPNYGVDLLAANGLVKTRASKIPGDEAGLHPYGNNPTRPDHLGNNHLAIVFNMIGEASGGDYLPIAPTEQGISWNNSGSTTNPNAAVVGPQLSYDQEKAYFDLWHGNIPWSINTRLQGPGANTHLPTGDGTGGTITLASRRSKMKKVVSCPTMFALREPSNASGEYGLTFDSSGNQKYVLGREDAFHVFRTL